MNARSDRPPTTEETADWLHWLDRRNPGFGSAIAIEFGGQFIDKGWVGEPSPVEKKQIRRFLPENRQTRLL